MKKDERPVAIFFAALAIVIVLTLAHGCVSGELRFHDGKGCREDYCEPEQ